MCSDALSLHLYLTQASAVMLWPATFALGGLLSWMILSHLHDRLAGTPKGLKPFTSIPGPTQYPLLGNLLEFIGDSMGDPRLHLTFYKWQQRFGRLYRGWVPGVGTFIILSEPELMPAVWGRPGLPKSSVYQEFRVILGPKKQDSLLTSLDHSQGSLYREVRKAIAPFFATHNLRELVPLMRVKALKLTRYLNEQGPAAAINVEDAMGRVTVDTFLAASGFGTDLKALDFQPCPPMELLHYATYEALAGYANPLRKLVRTFLPFLPYCREYKRKHLQLWGVWESMAETLMQQPEPEDAAGKLTLGDTLRSLMKHSEQGQELGMDWLRTEIAELILGGMDTGSQTLAFTLLSIALHPEVQEKVAVELQAAGLLASPQQPEPRDFGWADISSLPYLDAVLKESMRLWPVVSTGTDRVVPEDMELGGYHIPKGTSIQIPQFLIHLLPDYYPEPLKFNPSRWLNEPPAEQLHDVHGVGAQAEKKDLNIESPSYPFKPFSHGSRDCPGQRLALVEMMTILPIVLGRFEVQLAEGMGDWEACWQRQTCAFILRLSGGIWMHFKPRATA